MRAGTAAIAGTGAGLLLAYAYGCSIGGAIAAAAAWGLAGTVLGRYKTRNLKEQKEFRQLIQYMEQLLYHFQRRPKLLAALRMTVPMLDEPLKSETEAVLRFLETHPESRGRKGAFSGLEDRYPYRELKQLHGFLIKVEEMGGEYQGGIRLLLEQVRELRASRELYVRQLESVYRKLLLCTLLSVGIGFFSLRMLPVGWQITGMSVYQKAAAAELVLYSGLLLLFSLYFTKRRQLKNEEMTEEDVRRSRSFLQAKPEENRKKLIINLSAPLAFLAAAVYLRSWYGAAAAAALIILALTGSRRRKQTALHRLRREVLWQLPQWMRTLSVHLQTQTVQTALLSSMAGAPPVIAVYLRQLQRELYEDPVSIEPYRNFMKELQLPEAEDTLLLLYGMNGMGREQAEEQMIALTEKYLRIQEQAREEKKQDLIAVSGFLSVLPMGMAVLQLVGTMQIVMLVFMKG